MNCSHLQMVGTPMYHDACNQVIKHCKYHFIIHLAIYRQLATYFLAVFWLRYVLTVNYIWHVTEIFLVMTRMMSKAYLLTQTEARVFISFPSAAEAQVFKWGRPLTETNGAFIIFLYELNIPDLRRIKTSGNMHEYS